MKDRMENYFLYELILNCINIEFIYKYIFLNWFKFNFLVFSIFL